MKGMSLLLTVAWGALLSAIAFDSFGYARGSWFEPMGLGFLPEYWRMASEYITQYVWSGFAFFWFWIISSIVMFQPAVLERFISSKKRANA
ncbi:hypothetical protein [Pseudomonas putida]